MIAQPENDNAFFIFNDNQGQFVAHKTNPKSANGCTAGGGNAIVRPYQCQTPPRAGGIPTGDYSHKNSDGGYGYAKLTPEVKALIDEAIASIAKVVADNGYDTIYYSSNGHGGLGTRIFNPAPDVTSYLIQAIDSLATPKDESVQS